MFRFFLTSYKAYIFVLVILSFCRVAIATMIAHIGSSSISTSVSRVGFDARLNALMPVC